MNDPLDTLIQILKIKQLVKEHDPDLHEEKWDDNLVFFYEKVKEIIEE